MADHSKIEWTDATWTPIRARSLGVSGDPNDKTYGRVGWHCEHASEACRFCYAESMNRRLGTGLDFKPGHRKDIEIFLDEKMLLAPLRRKKSKMIFVCSMTDLFADFVQDEWIDRIFAVMARCPQHRFQVLTKRARRMREYMQSPLRKRTIAGAVMSVSDAKAREGGHAARITMADFDAAFKDDKPFANVWLGISAEDQANWDERKMDLAHTLAAIRFASFEPLLGPIEQPDIGEFIDWAIVGGESGKGARPMHPDWARSIRNQCQAAGVPFFFKQWGAWSQVAVEGIGGNERKPSQVLREPYATEMICVGKKAAGRLLDGELYDGMPT